MLEQGMRDRLLNRIGYATIAALLVGMMALASVPHAWAAPIGRDVVDQDLVVEQGQTINGDVNVTNGDLTVYGTIDGKATIVNGDAEIYGTITGDLTVITGGDITLYAGSDVQGNVVDMGGEVVRDPEATVTGNVGMLDNPVDELGNLHQRKPGEPGRRKHMGQPDKPVQPDGKLALPG